MSFSDNYLKLREKRLKMENTRPTDRTDENSFQEKYLQLRQQRLAKDQPKQTAESRESLFDTWLSTYSGREAHAAPEPASVDGGRNGALEAGKKPVYAPTPSGRAEQVVTTNAGRTALAPKAEPDWSALVQKTPVSGRGNDGHSHTAGTIAQTAQAIGVSARDQLQKAVSLNNEAAEAERQARDAAQRAKAGEGVNWQAEVFDKNAAAQEKRRQARELGITNQNVNEFLALAQELAGKEEWTPDDKAMAETIYQAIRQPGDRHMPTVAQRRAMRQYAKTGEITDELPIGARIDDELSPYADLRGDWLGIYETLAYRLHPMSSAVVMGLASGTGAKNISKAASNILARIAPEEVKQETDRVWQGYDEAAAYLKKEAPVTYTAGEISGTLLLLTSLNQVFGVAMGAEKAIASGSRIAPLVKQAASSALAYAAESGIKDMDAMTELDPNKRMPVTKGLRRAGVKAASGWASQIAGGLAGSGIGTFLRNHGLMTPFAEFMRQIGQGVASGLTYTGTNYALSEEKPTKEEVASQLLVSFGFTVLSSLMHTLPAVKGQTEAFQERVRGLQEYYQNAQAQRYATPEEYLQAMTDLQYQTLQIKEDLNSVYLAGQQKNVDTLNDVLDEIERGLGNIIHGAGAGGTGGVSPVAPMLPTSGGADTAAEDRKIMTIAQRALEQGAAEGAQQSEGTGKQLVPQASISGNQEPPAVQDAGGGIMLPRAGERRADGIMLPRAGQQNTAPGMEAAESTAVNDDPAQHTPEEQKRIGDYVSAVNYELREMLARAEKSKGRVFERKDLAPVSEKQAQDAARILGGDYAGYTNAINSNGAWHIIKKHGAASKGDRSLADMNDAARLEYVLQNYDTVEQVTYASGDIDTSAEFRDKDNKPAPMLRYAKRIDGTYYVVEAIPDSKFKKFWVVSAYIEGADAVTQAPDAQSPGNTPKASLASPATAQFDYTVSQGADFVNTARQDAATPLASPSEDAGAAQGAQEASVPAETQNGAQGVQDALVTALLTSAADSGMGEAGQRTLGQFYTDGVDKAGYFAGFIAYYNAGRAGTPMETVSTPYTGRLSREAGQAAYNAGQMDAIGSTAGQQNTAPGMEAAGKTYISMEEYANTDAPIWNNVPYEDTETKTRLMQEKHEEMVNSGRVVVVPQETMDEVAKSYPDLRSVKKSERLPVLKAKIDQLKTALRQVLNGLKRSYEFEVNGRVLEAKLYDTGVAEVMRGITQPKANMLFSSADIFKNAEYLYSTPDYEGNPNIYRWNYFYTPVQIGDDTVGVRIAVRDMARKTSSETLVDSQIYNWKIKKDVTLGGEQRGGTPDKLGASSVTSENSISNSTPIVNPEIVTGPPQAVLPMAGERRADGIMLPRAVQQKTAPGMEAAESTAVNDDPAQHTPEEQRMIEEYKKSADSIFAAWITRVRGLKNQDYKNRIRTSVPVKTDRATRVAGRLTGVETEGFGNIINGSSVQHIDNRHGVFGAADHSMADLADFSRIGYVLDNFTAAEILQEDQLDPQTQKLAKGWRNSDGTRAAMVRFSMPVNGTYYVVEAVPSSKAHALAVVTAYMTKKGHHPQSSAELAGKPSQQLTSETPVEILGGAKQSIPQSPSAVNSTQTLLASASESGMGEAGQRTLGQFYTDGVDTAGYFAGFIAYYNAGREGTSIETVSTPYTGQLSPEAGQAAYNAGQMDAIAAQKTVAGARDNGYNEGEDKYVQEGGTQYGQENGGDQILREGRDGLLPQRTGQQAGAVSEGTEGTGGERRADAETGASGSGSGQAAKEETVSARSLFPEAKQGAQVRVTEQITQESRTLAEKNGVTVTSFHGEIPLERGGVIRGYAKADTGEIGVQYDNPEFSQADLTRHEVAEVKIGRGELDVDEVLERAAERVDPAKLEAAIRLYYDSNPAEGVDGARRELVCDAGDHMNQLRYDVDNGTLGGQFVAIADLLDEVLDAVHEVNNELTGNAFELEGGAVNTAATEVSGRVADNVEFSQKIYWRPQLTAKEWDILNRTMEREIESKDRFLDSETKWTYKKEKGLCVFAIYGIGDGTEATPLYAVSGDRAGHEYARLQKILGGESVGRKARSVFARLLGDIKSGERHTGDGVRDDGHGGQATGDVRVFERARGSDGGGNQGGGIEDNTGSEVRYSLKGGEVVVNNELTGNAFELEGGAVNTAATEVAGRVADKVEFSQKIYWRPQLTAKEWDILNRTMEREIESSDHFLNPATKWLYKEEKGERVFAVYGVGDGTEATPLYAVGGEKAVRDYEKTQRFLRGEKNGRASRAMLDGILAAVESGQSESAYRLLDDGNGRASIGNVQIFKQERGSDGRRDHAGSPEDQAESEVRYSLKDSNILELQRENAELKELVLQYAADVDRQWNRANRAEGQLKRTEKPTVRAEDAKKLAGALLKRYGSTLETQDISAGVEALANYIVQHGGEDGELFYSEVRRRAVEIAGQIVRSASALREDFDAGIYETVRGHLRQSMTIAAENAHDVSADWNDWRKRHFGAINVGINNHGTPVDSVYAELSDMYPWLFPGNVTHPADQLQHMADALDALRPVYENPYSYYMAQAIEECANDVIEGVLGEGVRQTPPTFADRQAAKLEEAKAEGRRALAEQRKATKREIEEARLAERMHEGAVAARKLREQREKLTRERVERVQAAILRERTVRERQLAELKEHYQQVQREAAARREDSRARTRLLNIARRLQNKKLPAVNRALLDQYVGELDTVAKSMTEQTLERLTDLRDWYEDRKQNDPDFISDPRIEKVLERLHKKQIHDLSAEQVADLTEVLLHIENELRTERQLIDSEDRRDVYLMGIESIRDVENSAGSRPDGLRGAAGRLVTETLSPVRMIHRIVGYADNSPLYRLTQKLADGQRSMFDYQMRARRLVERWVTDKKFTDRIAGKNAQEIEITGLTKDGIQTVKITPAMRIALYLHSLNDQNLRHIRDGGITVPDMRLYKQGKTAEAYDRGATLKLTPSQVRSITAHMSEAERAFAQAIHDYYNGMSQREINEVSEKLKGYSLAQVEHYFPINTDKSFTKSDFDTVKFDGSIEGMGFLKERVNAANPILLRDASTVLSQSIQQHSRYVGLAVPVRNFMKVWGVNQSSFNADGSRNAYESSVQKAVGQTWGEAGKDYVEKMMRDLQGVAKGRDWFGEKLSKIRSNYAGAVLTFNWSVAMKQAASYPTAGAVIGFKPLMRAMADFGKVDMDLIAKYTPLQWYRSQGFSTQELGDIAKRDTLMSRALSHKVLNWVQGMDVLTTRKLWKACEYYVRSNEKTLAVGTDAYYKAVAEIYNRVIEETQPNYTTMQRPQLLRSENELLQSLSMFKTQPFQNFNILYDALGNLNAKRTALTNATAETRSQADAEYRQARERATWAVSSQLMQLAVFAGMTFAWGAFRGKRKKYEDEDGEVTAASALAGIGKDMLGGAASMLPFGSDVWELASSRLFGERYYGMETVTVDAINDAVKGFQKAEKVLQEVWQGATSDEEIDWTKQGLQLKSALNSISKAFGIPLENVNNLFDAVFRVATKTAKGKYEGRYAYLRWTVSPSSSTAEYYDNLYDAYLHDGDAHGEIYWDMVDSGDFTEKKIQNAMEDRMKKAQGVNSVKDLKKRYEAPER